MRINSPTSQRLSVVTRATQWMFLSAVALALLSASAVTTEERTQSRTRPSLFQNFDGGAKPIQLAERNLTQNTAGVLRFGGERPDPRLDHTMSFRMQEPAVDVYRITQGFERDVTGGVDYDLVAGKDTLIRSQLYTTGSEVMVDRASCGISYEGHGVRHRFYPATGVPAARLNTSSTGSFNGGNVFDCWIPGGELASPGNYDFDMEITLAGGATSYTLPLGRRTFSPTGDLRLLLAGWVHPPGHPLYLPWNDGLTVNVLETMLELQRRYPLRAGVGAFDLSGDQPHSPGLRYYLNPAVYPCTLDGETVEVATSRCDNRMRAGADFIMRFFNAVFDSRAGLGRIRDRFDLAGTLASAPMGWYGQACHGSQRSMGSQFDANPVGSSITVIGQELAHCMGEVSASSPHSDGHSHSLGPWLIPLFGNPPPVNMRTHLPLMPVSMMNASAGNVSDTILEGYEWNHMRGVFISRSNLLADVRTTTPLLASSDRLQAAHLFQAATAKQEAEMFGLIALMDRSGKVLVDYAGRLGKMSAGQTVPKEEKSAYALVFLDGNGKELNRVGISPSFDSVHGDSDLASVSLITPFPANSARIEFQKDGNPLYSTQCGGPLPVIEDLTAADDKNGNIQLHWKASNPNKTPLRYMVLFTSDAKLPALPIAIGLDKEGFLFPTAFAPGASNARLTVHASDGCNVVTATSKPISIQPKPPVVIISWPRSGMSFVAGQPITLVGAAYDYTDGPLGDQNLFWDVDGQIIKDKNEQLTLRLTPGDHRITLRSVAASGLSASTYIKVVALADTDRDGTPDVYEVLHNCLSKDMFDSNLDPDGDGFSSRGEYLLGTDPCKKEAFLKDKNSGKSPSESN